MHTTRTLLLLLSPLLQVIDAITPSPDEIVLPKTSSSVFNSTTLDYILRNMDKRFLIIAGCVTEQCVAHAVKDAADLGYLVTLVTGEIFAYINALSVTHIQYSCIYSYFFTTCCSDLSDVEISLDIYVRYL